jgi:hypothetical protein
MLGIRSNDKSVKKSITMGEFGQSVTDHVHETIHDGYHRLVCIPFSGLGVGDIQNYSIVTSSDIIHFFPNVLIKSEGLFTVLEGSSVTSAGTQQPIINNNRISATNINETFYENTNYNTSSAGIALCNSMYLPAGNREGAEARIEAEIEATTNTTYIFSIESLAASNRGSFKLFYYVDY